MRTFAYEDKPMVGALEALPPFMFHFKQGSLGKKRNMSKYVKNPCERTELFIKGKN